MPYDPQLSDEQKERLRNSLPDLSGLAGHDIRDVRNMLADRQQAINKAYKEDEARRQQLAQRLDKEAREKGGSLDAIKVFDVGEQGEEGYHPSRRLSIKDIQEEKWRSDRELVASKLELKYGDDWQNQATFDEIEEYRTVPRKELPKNLPMPSARQVEEWQPGRTPEEVREFESDPAWKFGGSTAGQKAWRAGIVESRRGIIDNQMRINQRLVAQGKEPIPITEADLKLASPGYMNVEFDSEGNVVDLSDGFFGTLWYETTTAFKTGYMKAFHPKALAGYAAFGLEVPGLAALPQLADWALGGPMKRWLQETHEDFLQELEIHRQQYISEDSGFVTDAINAMAEALPQFAVQIGASVATGGSSALVSLGMFAGTAAMPVARDKYFETRKAQKALGATNEEADSIAMVNGIFAGLITGTVAFGPGKVILAPIKNVASKSKLPEESLELIRKSVIRGHTARIAAGGAAEGAEELVEDIGIDIISRWIQADPSLSTELFFQYEGFWRDKLVGAVAGVGLGGAAAAGISLKSGRGPTADEIDAENSRRIIEFVNERRRSEYFSQLEEAINLHPNVDLSGVSTKELLRIAYGYEGSKTWKPVKVPYKMSARPEPTEKGTEKERSGVLVTPQLAKLEVNARAEKESGEKSLPSSWDPETSPEYTELSPRTIFTVGGAKAVVAQRPDIAQLFIDDPGDTPSRPLVNRLFASDLKHNPQNDRKELKERIVREAKKQGMKKTPGRAKGVDSGKAQPKFRVIKKSFGDLALSIDSPLPESVLRAAISEDADARSRAMSEIARSLRERTGISDSNAMKFVAERLSNSDVVEMIKSRLATRSEFRVEERAEMERGDFRESPDPAAEFFVETEAREARERKEIQDTAQRRQKASDEIAKRLKKKYGENWEFLATNEELKEYQDPPIEAEADTDPEAQQEAEEAAPEEAQDTDTDAATDAEEAIQEPVEVEMDEDKGEGEDVNKAAKSLVGDEPPKVSVKKTKEDSEKKSGLVHSMGSLLNRAVGSKNPLVSKIANKFVQANFEADQKYNDDNDRIRQMLSKIPRRLRIAGPKNESILADILETDFGPGYESDPMAALKANEITNGLTDRTLEGIIEIKEYFEEKRVELRNARREDERARLMNTAYMDNSKFVDLASEETLYEHLDSSDEIVGKNWVVRQGNKIYDKRTRDYITRTQAVDELVNTIVPDSWGYKNAYFPHTFSGKYKYFAYRADGSYEIFGDADNVSYNDKDAIRYLENERKNGEFSEKNGFVRWLAAPAFDGKDYYNPAELSKMDRSLAIVNIRENVSRAMPEDVILSDADLGRAISSGLARFSKPKRRVRPAHTKHRAANASRYDRSVTNVLYNYAYRQYRWNLDRSISKATHEDRKKLEETDLAWANEFDDVHNWVVGNKPDNLSARVDSIISNIPLVNQMFGRNVLQRSLSAMRQYQYVAKLFTFRQHVVNSFQVFQHTLPIVGPKSFADGIRFYNSAEGKEFFRNHGRINTRGHYVEGDSGVTSIGKRLQNHLSEKREVIDSKLPWSTSAEARNQNLSLAVFYNHLVKDKGYSTADAVAEARRLTFMTQFTYVKANQPRILRGHVKRTLFQFQRFPLMSVGLLHNMIVSGRMITNAKTETANQLESKYGKNWKDRATKEEMDLYNDPTLDSSFAETVVPGGYSGIAYYLGSQVILGGVMASAPISLYTMIMSAFGDDHEDEMDEFVRQLAPGLDGKAADVILYGLPSLAGVSLSGSLSLGRPLFGDTAFERIGSFLTGPTGSDIASAIVGLREMEKTDLAGGKLSQAAYALYHNNPMLQSLQNVAKIAHGDYDYYDRKARFKFKKDLTYAVRKLLGFTTMDDKMLTITTKMIYDMQGELDRATHKAVVAIYNGNKAEADEIIKEWNSLNPHAPMSEISIERRLKNYEERQKVAREDRTFGKMSEGVQQTMIMRDAEGEINEAVRLYNSNYKKSIRIISDLKKRFPKNKAFIQKVFNDKRYGSE